MKQSSTYVPLAQSYTTPVFDLVGNNPYGCGSTAGGVQFLNTPSGGMSFTAQDLNLVSTVSPGLERG